MIVVMMLSAIGIPAILLLTSWALPKLRVLYDGVAVACAYIFGVIAAYAIYKIIRDDAVFMTSIHGVFNNGVFLGTGAYLGNYGLYRLLLRTIEQWRKS